jgi:predicted nucleic acid-binding protein
VARQLSVDTTLLIDLQRERRRLGEEGPAHRFLASEPDSTLFISPVVLGEFAEGFADPEHDAIRAVRNAVEVLPLDEGVSLTYARIARTLRARGTLIGTNDLWIGATSLYYGLPLVTVNATDFRRVEGLDVLTYR